MQPFRRFGMDGVVFFSDILIPLPPMGLEVRLDEGGPKLPSPVRDRAGRRAASRLSTRPSRPRSSRRSIREPEEDGRTALRP